MEKIKIGFIGCGNMGGALAKAVAKSQNYEIFLADSFSPKMEELSEQIGGKKSDVCEIVNTCKYIFLGVKPQGMAQLLESIADILKSRQDRFILVTMAAGIKIEKINTMLGTKLPTIRIMPNTPVSVGEGMILYSKCKAITDCEEKEFCEILEFAGKLDKLPEDLIDAGCAISGCGPAFVYTFLESLQKAGVNCGLSEEKALLYAAQTLKGASELLLQSNESPNDLRVKVCSPKGSTIEGVEVLLNSDFEKIIDKTVNASFKRTVELGE